MKHEQELLKKGGRIISRAKAGATGLVRGGDGGHAGIQRGPKWTRPPVDVEYKHPHELLGEMLAALARERVGAQRDAHAVGCGKVERGRLDGCLLEPRRPRIALAVRSAAAARDPPAGGRAQRQGGAWPRRLYVEATTALQPGDVVLFDNLQTQHSVTPTDAYAVAGRRRLMTRTASPAGSTKTSHPSTSVCVTTYPTENVLISKRSCRSCTPPESTPRT